MKIDKNIILNLIYALALFFGFMHLFQGIISLSQLIHYNVGTGGVTVSTTYLNYAKVLVGFAVTGIALVLTLNIMKFFNFEPKVKKIFALGQVAFAILFIVLLFISKLNIPYISYDTIPPKISVMDYELSSSIQSMLMSMLFVTVAFIAVSAMEYIDDIKILFGKSIKNTPKAPDEQAQPPDTQQ